MTKVFSTYSTFLIFMDGVNNCAGLNGNFNFGSSSSVFPLTCVRYNNRKFENFLFSTLESNDGYRINTVRKVLCELCGYFLIYLAAYSYTRQLCLHNIVRYCRVT